MLLTLVFLRTKCSYVMLNGVGIFLMNDSHVCFLILKFSYHSFQNVGMQILCSVYFC